MTLQETRFLSILHVFRGFQLFSTHQMYSEIVSLKVVHIPLYRPDIPIKRNSLKKKKKRPCLQLG